MEKKVQLKEQEIVGQEVVLSDIYPKTDTTSVEDAVTGASLDVKLDYLVEMINDKLTRVVNSVNNRTGVVVLNANDVGLGNVDNVSYSEIKNWTDDAIKQMFGNKKLLLFNTRNDLDEWLEKNNDPIYDNVLFYIKSIDMNDAYQAMIGYLSYDTSNHELKINTRNGKVINTIGKTDQSLDYENGELKVHLSTHENNILSNYEELYNGWPGLAVPWDATGHLLFTFNSIYDFSKLDSTKYSSLKGLLLTDDNYNDDELPNVYVRINDRNVVNKTTGQILFKLNKPSIDSRVASALLTNGISYAFVVITNSEDSISQIENLDSLAITPELIHHNTLVGTLAYSKFNDNWSLRLMPIQQTSSWGLTTDPVYQHGTMNYVGDSILRVETTGDASGIQILSKPNQYDITQTSANGKYSKHDPTSAMNHKYTPEGVLEMYDDTSNRQGGLFIPTDASLNTYSYADYGLSKEILADGDISRSKLIANWFANTPYYLNQSEVNEHPGYLYSPTFIGVNLVKLQTNAYHNEDEEESKFIPISGLKIVDSEDSSRHGTVTWEDLGLREDVDKTRIVKELDGVTSPFAKFYRTGGLMVNVGEGLEIMPQHIPESGDKYNDEGKINVRLGKGLTLDDFNRITYDPDTLEVGTVSSGGVSNLQGIVIIDEYRRDGHPMKYRMNPVTVNPSSVVATHSVTLGNGLRLVIDKNDIRNIILNEMTIIKLSWFGNTEYSDKDKTHTAKIKDYINIDTMSYREITKTHLPELLDFFSDLKLLDTAYYALTALRDGESYSTNLEYTTNDAVHCMTIERLLNDEIHNGGTTRTVAEGYTIEKLLENYAERHNTTVGDYKRFAENPNAVKDYTEDMKWVDYTSDELAIFKDLSTAQTQLFNEFLNVTRALRKAIGDEDLWNDTMLDKSYKDTDTADSAKLTLKLQKGDIDTYVSFIVRMDCSGMMGAVLRSLGYDTDQFTTALLLKEENPYRLLSMTTREVSEDFSYKVDPTLKDLRFGDIVVTTNHVWMYGWTSDITSDGDVLYSNAMGVDFLNGSRIQTLVNNLEALIDQDEKYNSKGSALSYFFSVAEVDRLSSKEITDERMKLAIRYGKGDEDGWQFSN